MRGPTPILDYLSPVNDNFHALPHVTDPLEDVDGLEDIQKSVIRANHEINLTALQGYHQQVSQGREGLLRRGLPCLAQTGQ